MDGLSIADRFVVLAVDCFTFLTKEASPIVHWVEDMFKDHPPEKFQTDNGREFRNAEMSYLLSSWNSSEIHSNPYHPQTNGQIERLNRTLLSRITSAVETQMDSWSL